MPMYCYRCPQCGCVHTEFKPMAHRDHVPSCSICGGSVLTQRDYAAEKTHTPLQEFGKPIAMYSVAPETPEQLADLRRKCPDVKFDDQLVPLAHSRAEKLRILKAVDAVELS